MTRFRFAAALGASAWIFATSAAVADTHWVVTGVFDDGTTLSGYFNINVYDQLSGFELTTEAGPVLAATVYKTAIRPRQAPRPWTSNRPIRKTSTSPSPIPSRSPRRRTPS